MNTGNNNKNEERKIDTVYNYLRESILTGDIASGERIVMRNIANNLNVSDIPVREALQLLKADGLVKIIPYSGAIVTSPSLKDLEEAMIIRTSLEKLAIETSAPKLTEKDITELKLCLNKMKNSLNKNDYRRYSVYNRKFHNILFRHTYKLLLTIMEYVNCQSERARIIFKKPLSILQSFNEHEQMLKAIEKKDFNSLTQIIINHRERVRRDLAKVIEETKKDCKNKIYD